MAQDDHHGRCADLRVWGRWLISSLMRVSIPLVRCDETGGLKAARHTLIATYTLTSAQMVLVYSFLRTLCMRR